jgi:hypothetical protein
MTHTTLIANGTVVTADGEFDGDIVHGHDVLGRLRHRYTGGAAGG